MENVNNKKQTILGGLVLLVILLAFGTSAGQSDQARVLLAILGFTSLAVTISGGVRWYRYGKNTEFKDKN